jgi:hypothetical protein
MTNEQLAVLLESYAAHLRASIDYLAEHLGDENALARATLREYIGPRLPWPAHPWGAGAEANRDPANWREVPSNYLILSGLEALHGKFQDHIELLGGVRGEA